MSHASYIKELFDPLSLELEVIKICERINTSFKDVDYIVGSGISGITMAAIISYKMNKNLFIVRKPEDTTHSNIMIREGTEYKIVPKITEFSEIENNKIKTAIIIDDLISSGTTIKRITHEVQRENILIVGVILYHEAAYNGNSFGKKEEGLDFPVWSSYDLID